MQNDKKNSQHSIRLRLFGMIVLLIFSYHITLAQIDYQIIGTWYAYQEKVEILEDGCSFKKQLYTCKAYNNTILLTTPQREVITIEYKLIGDELHLQARGFSLVLYRDENAVPNIEPPFQIIELN